MFLNVEPRRHFTLKAAGSGEFKIDAQEDGGNIFVRYVDTHAY